MPLILPSPIRVKTGHPTTLSPLVTRSLFPSTPPDQGPMGPRRNQPASRERNSHQRTPLEEGQSTEDVSRIYACARCKILFTVYYVSNDTFLWTHPASSYYRMLHIIIVKLEMGYVNYFYSQIYIFQENNCLRV